MSTPTVHNPTHFNPADYTVEDYLDNKRPLCYGSDPADLDQYRREVAAWEADMLRMLGPDWRAKSHRCIHCGNGSVRWITAVRHAPTGDIVVFGSDCTKRLGFRDAVTFKLALLQARGEAQQVRFAIWTKRQAFLAENPGVAAALTTIGDPVHARNAFAHDVVGKLNRYGDLSVKQAAALISSLARDVEYAARREAEAAQPKGDAPTGRQVVSGEVVSVKTYEGAYGFSTKMTVKLDSNARVWMTVPAGSDIQRGDRVTVRATFTVSDTDRSFAFGKRPTVVEHVKAQADSAA